MRAIVQLQLRQMLGGKRMFLGFLILGLPLLLALMTRVFGGFAQEVQLESGIRTGDGARIEAQVVIDAVYLVFLFVMYPLFCSILLSLLYATSLVSQELENKTLTYLFSRPLAKWKVLGGQYLATAIVIASGVCLSCVGGWLVSGLPLGVRGLSALLVPCIVGTFAYCALFCLIGLLVPRRAIPAGIVHAVVVEGLVSFIPAAINKLTMNFHLRAIGFRITGITDLPPDLRQVLEMIMDESIPTALLALTGLTLALLAASSYIITTRQFVVNEQG